MHDGRCVLKSVSLIYLAGFFRTLTTWVRFLHQQVAAVHPVSVLPVSYGTGIHSAVQKF
jgi:folate-dependent phosphoribosylglycinamide formyltransferase PurN